MSQKVTFKIPKSELAKLEAMLDKALAATSYFGSKEDIARQERINRYQIETQFLLKEIKRFLAVILILLAPFAASAQKKDANACWLKGWVRDVSGGAIADAELTIVGQNKTYKVKTDSFGFYKILLLADSYNVTLEQTVGFKSAKRNDAQVSNEKTTYVDFTPDVDSTRAWNITTIRTN